MHDPASVENPAAPSREADSTHPPGTPDPPYLSKLFGPPDPSCPLPPIVGELVSGLACGVAAPPPAVAATALATLAACLGPRVKLQYGSHFHSLGFNVVVSHAAPRTLPWFDVVTAPFVGRVFEMQLALARTSKEKLRAEVTRQQKEFESATKTTTPNGDLLRQLQLNLHRAQTRLQPFVASTSLAPKDLDRLLPKSFDGGMVLVGVCSDPGSDLLRRKAPERAGLVELLNRSWEGAPLSFGGNVHEGHLSLLWQTRVPTKELLGRCGFEPGFVAAPTLFFQDGGAGRTVSKLADEELWRTFCSGVFDLRCRRQDSVDQLGPAVEEVLQGFEEALGGAIEHVPTVLRPHVTWLPQLAVRLSFLFALLTCESDAVIIRISTMQEAIRVTRWLGRAHLLTVAAAAPTGMVDGTDGADKEARLLAKIRAKGPLTRRELRRSFNNQQVRWFDEALDGLLEQKKVRFDDEMRLVACP